MLSRKYSCYGCTRRTINCHSTCCDYLSDKAESDRNNEIIRQYKQYEKAHLETVKRLSKINERKSKTPRYFK